MKIRLGILVFFLTVMVCQNALGRRPKKQKYGSIISTDQPIQNFFRQIRNLTSLEMGGDCPNDELPSEEDICDKDYAYRTYDGTCNNLNNYKWGAINDDLLRMLPGAFDGIGGFRQSVKGGDLPRPRDIRLQLLTDVDRPARNVTFTFLIFGLGVAHDTSFSTPPVAQFLEPINGVQCCPPPGNNLLCAPIQIGTDDPFYSKFNITCINFQRSPIATVCPDGRMHIANTITSFMDLSIVYGSNKYTEKKLRKMDGSGKLISVQTQFGELLPPNDNPRKLFCPAANIRTCFNAGDERVNEHSLLMSVHTMYMREHNRVADALHGLNPHWQEEKLFQEARKIVIAEYQAIAFGEYIPQLIGPDLTRALNLSIGSTSQYDPNVRVGIFAEFSTCANRPHTMVQKHMGYGGLRMLDLFFNTDLIRNGHMGGIVKGMCSVKSEKYDRFQIDDLTNHLYQEKGYGYGVDMASIDIQRGRDHGLPRYVDMLEYCSGGQVIIHKFKDLKRVMTKKHIRRLERLYRNVRDIDLYVGIQMEKLTVPGSVVSPTTACIFGRGFYTLKHGDRFFFENQGVFTEAQLSTLRKSTFSRIICDNTDLTELQPHALNDEGPGNELQKCDSLPTVDLSAWKEDPNSAT